MAISRGHIRLLTAALLLGVLVLLLALVVPFFILPLLPPLGPYVSHLLLRLRDVCVFIAFTTAIAIGIFSTQRRDSGYKKKPSLDHHPLASIFGETFHGEVDYRGEHSKERLPTTDALQTSGGEEYEIVNSPLFQERRPPKPAMRASQTQSVTPRKLHRRSSSLGDNVNFETDPGVPSEQNSTPTTDGVLKTRPAKRVSFSTTSPQYMYEQMSDDESYTQVKQEQVGKPSGASSMSPGELTKQADAFIAKFKEQMRMQRLGSFQRQQRRVA